MIKPPSWCKDATPTQKGWIHPKTGEILVGGSIPQRDIDEYLGVKFDSIKAEAAHAQEVQIDIMEDVEADIMIEDDLIIVDVEDDSEIDWEVEEIDLDSMTKAQLIETAEEWEINIDPKGTKAQIKAILEEELY